MPDIINARAAEPMPPPLLTAHLRNGILRGHRAMLCRHQHNLDQLVIDHPSAGYHLREIARLRGDIAELEAP